MAFFCFADFVFGSNVGGVEMGNRKIGHNRRALGVINQSLIGAKPYPCVVNKRGFPG